MITILIPVYNEEKVIGKTLERLSKFAKRKYDRYEILLVDDGSSDRTVRIVSDYSKTDRNIRIVRHENNRGIGAALKTGLKESRGDTIITMDSDLTYPPEDIPKLTSAMIDKKADMVIGTPYIKGGDRSEMPFIRFFLSRCVNLMDQILFGLDFTTPTSFFRAWSRDLAKNIKIEFERFEAVSESAINAHRLGYRIVEVPVKYRGIKDRQSKLKVFSTMRKHLEMDFKLLFKRG